MSDLAERLGRGVGADTGFVEASGLQAEATPEITWSAPFASSRDRTPSHIHLMSSRAMGPWSAKTIVPGLGAANPGSPFEVATLSRPIQEKGIHLRGADELRGIRWS
jgi:hypothetical protein